METKFRTIPSRIIKLPAVKNRTGLSTTTIYRRMSEGTFPVSITLGKRAVGWLEHDINNWIEQCMCGNTKMINRQDI